MVPHVVLMVQVAERAVDLKPNEFTYWNTLGVIAASEGTRKNI